MEAHVCLQFRLLSPSHATSSQSKQKRTNYTKKKIRATLWITFFVINWYWFQCISDTVLLYTIVNLQPQWFGKFSWNVQKRIMLEIINFILKRIKMNSGYIDLLFIFNYLFNYFRLDRSIKSLGAWEASNFKICECQSCCINYTLEVRFLSHHVRGWKFNC